MKRTLLYATIFLAGLGLASAFFSARRQVAAVAPVSAVPEPAVLVSAPGRIEPVSEEVLVGAALGGKLKSVLVEEGDRVRQGQVLAEIENADFVARVAVAEAQVAQADAALRRVVNGARTQERLEALASVREAEAVLENARAEVERRRRLFENGDISRSEFERAERQHRVAAARVEAAKERHSFVDADAREEDRARAEADLALAKARLAEARATLEKTLIRAPIAGAILRKHVRAGESLGEKGESPIVTIGDSSVLRVRVEIDETDVGRVRVGQAAYITADAYGDRRFAGKVVRVGTLVGKKNVRTERPTERVDTKVLEALIELEDGDNLPSGLRVDAFIG